MHTFFRSFFCLASLGVVPVAIYSLPTCPEVITGEAVFLQGETSLEIHASHQAIIEYESFHIGPQEKVHFFQPSSDSHVLNRVVGADPSQILGSLTSNGQVFLVNPQGIYFGKDAVVEVGALVASTLDISNQDYLEGRFIWKGSSSGLIVQEGSIHSAEGSIVLLASQVENRGLIRADKGEVLIATATKATLDFSGDGLVQFVVEEEGFVEGDAPVFLSPQQAARVIHSVVNQEGIEEGSWLVVEQGVVKIVGTVQGKKVHIEAPEVTLNASIQAKEIYVLGQDIRLAGGHIDACLPEGGGSIYIGGDYQGKGELRIAEKVLVLPDTLLSASALEKGTGGTVVLFAKERLGFYGTISSLGGPLGGDGGTIETSGLSQLSIQGAKVYADAPYGKNGSWLLDPNTISISSSGSCSLSSASVCSDDDSSCTVDVDTLNASSADVVLCAYTSISLHADIKMTVQGADLQFKGSGSSPVAVYTNGWDVFVAKNSKLTFTHADVLVSGQSILGQQSASGSVTVTFEDASLGGVDNASIYVNAGSTGGGAFFQNRIGEEGEVQYIQIAGYDVVLEDTVHAGWMYLYAFHDLLIENTLYGTSTLGIGLDAANDCSLQGNIITEGAVTAQSRIIVGKNVTIDAQKEVLLYGGIQGAYACTIDASSRVELGLVDVDSLTVIGSAITFDSSVKTTNAISVTGSSSIVLSSSMESQASSITLQGPISSTGSGSLTMKAGTNIALNGTFNGARDWSLTGSSVRFYQSVGSSTALSSISITAASIIQSSSLVATNNILYTGAVSLGSNLTSQSGTCTITGACTLAGPVTLQTTNKNISLGSSVSGAQALAITAGSGIVTLSGMVSGLSSLSITAGMITQSSIASATSGVSYSAAALYIANDVTSTGGDITLSGPVTLTGPVTIQGKNVSCTSSLTGVYPLVVEGQQVSLQGALSSLTSLSITADNITQSASVTVTGAITYTGNATVKASITAGSIAIDGSVLLAADVTITAANASLSVTGGITGAYALLLNAGTGTITMGGAVTTLTSLQATAGTLIQSDAVQTVGGVTYTASTISIAGPITTSGAPIALQGDVVLQKDVSITSAGGAISLPYSARGSFALALSSGSGAISFGDMTGTLGNSSSQDSLTLSTSAGFSAGILDLKGGLDASGVDVTLSKQTTIGGRIVANTLTSSSGAYAVELLDGGSKGSFIASTISFSHTGALTIGSTKTSQLLCSDSLQVLYPSSFFLAGSIITQGKGVSVSSVTLTQDVSLDTTQGGSHYAGISFNGTVNGSYALTLNAGGLGSIQFQGAVGGGSSLGAVTIVEAYDVKLLAFSCASLHQVVGHGSILFAGAFVSSSDVRIDSVTNCYITGSMTTAASSSVSIATSGTFFWGSSSSSLGGSFSQIGSSSLVRLQGTLAPAMGPLTLTGAISVEGNTSLATSNQTLTLAGSVTSASAYTLTLSSGNHGDIVVTGDVSLLGGVQITTAHNVSMQGIQASTLAVQSSACFLEGVVSLTGSATIEVSDAVYLSQAITSNPLSIVGPVTLQADVALQAGSGALTLSSTVSGNYALTLASSSSIQCSGTMSIGSLVVEGGDASFIGVTTQTSQQYTVSSLSWKGTYTATAGSCQVTAPSILLTAATTITAAAGQISLQGPLTGAYALTMTAATVYTSSLQTSFCSVTSSSSWQMGGSITASGGIAQEGSGGISLLGNISLTTVGSSITLAGAVSGAHAFSLSCSSLHTSAITASSVTILNTSTWQVGGDIVVTGAIGQGGGGSISLVADATLQGSSVTLASAMGGSYGLEILATGPVSLAGLSLTGTVSVAGSTISLGAVSSSSVSVTNSSTWTIGASITAPGGIQQAGGGACVLGGNAVWTATDSAISFADVLQGSHYNLTVNAGTGSVSFASLTELGSVSITGGLVSLAAVTSTSLHVINSGIWQMGDSITASGGITQEGSGGISLLGNITLTTVGSSITLAGAVSGAHAFNLSCSSLHTSAITASSVTILNTSTWQVGGDIVVTGAIGQGGGGSISLVADATLQGSSVTLASAMGGSYGLEILATGPVSLAGLSLTGAVSVTGSTISLGAVSSSSVSVTNSSTWTIGASITAPGGIQQAGGGTCVLGGNAVWTATDSAVSFADVLQGSHYNLTVNAGTGAVSFISLTQLGSVSITGGLVSLAAVTSTSLHVINSGTWQVGGSIVCAGTILQSGTGSIALTQDSSLQGSAISLQGSCLGTSYSLSLAASTIFMAHDVSVGSFYATGALSLGSTFTALQAGSIDLSSIDCGGASVLLEATSGDLQVAGVVGNFTSLTLQGDNRLSLQGITTTTGIVTIADSFQTIFLSGTYQYLHQVYPVAVTVEADAFFISDNTSIIFASSVIGDSDASKESITCTAGSGNISFGGAVDNFYEVHIVSANDVSFSSMRAQLFTQEAGTGTTSWTAGAVVGTNWIATGNHYSLYGGLTVGGSCLLSHAGTAVLAGTIAVQNGFTQIGVGRSILDAPQMAVVYGDISFSGPVEVLQDIDIVSSSTNILFSSSLEGEGISVYMNACPSGTISLQTIGALSHLMGNIVLESNAITVVGPVYATSYLETDCQGSVDLFGIYDTGGAAFIVEGDATLIGNTTILTGAGSIIFNGTVNSASGRDFALTTYSTGTTAFKGAVGLSFPLTSIHASGGSLLSLSSTTTLGSQTYEDSQITCVGTAYIVDTGTITFTGPVTFTQNAQVQVGEGSIVYSSGIDGAIALIMGSTDSVQVEGQIGRNSALHSLSIVSNTASLQGVMTTSSQHYQSAHTVFTGSYTTTDSEILIDGDASIASSATFITGSGNIIGKKSVSGDQLTLTKTGGVFRVEGGCELSSLVTSAGVYDIELWGAASFVEGVSFANQGLLSMTTGSCLGVIDTTACSILSLEGGLQAESLYLGNLSLLSSSLLQTTSTLQLAGSITGGPALTIANGGDLHIEQPLTLAGPIAQIGQGAVYVSQDIVTTHGDLSFASSLTLLSSLSLEAPAHSLTCQAIDSIYAAHLVADTIVLQQAVETASLQIESTILYLQGDLYTTGDIAIDSAVEASGSCIIESSAGSILLSQGWEGGDAVSFSAATTITCMGNMGSSMAPSSLHMAAADISLRGTVYQAGAAQYTASNVYIASGMPTQWNMGSLIVDATSYVSAGSDLSFSIQSPVSFFSWQGESSPLFSIDSHTYAVELGEISGMGDLTLSAFSCSLTGKVSCSGVVHIEASITDVGGYMLSSTTTGSVNINAMQGGIGSSAAPLIVNLPSAVVTWGSSLPIYVEGAIDAGHFYCNASNYPPSITWNGIVSSCVNPPVPPVPPVPQLYANLFFVAGITTSQGALYGDAYFCPDFIQKSREKDRLEKRIKTDTTKKK